MYELSDPQLAGYEQTPSTSRFAAATESATIPAKSETAWTTPLISDVRWLVEKVALSENVSPGLYVNPM